MALRLLHLEDEDLDAELTLETLRHEGFDVLTTRVQTRDDFQRQLITEAFDVILADYHLPSFDGLSAQSLAAKLQPDTPFIFVSGTLGEDIAVERLKEGATDYVLKQHMARLPASIRRALAERAERLERRRAEAEIRRLNADLESRVLERTAEAASARSEAEQANRAKSQFLSRMSHDLRTPLNAVLGFAQLLKAETMSTEQLEGVTQILRAGEHLLDLINEVLDIARIESGRLSLSLEAVNVRAVVEHAVDLVLPMAAEQRISVRIDLQEPSNGVLLADRQRLNQVMLNLLSNAVKYNRHGGRVTVSTELVPERRLRVKVADTGVGIPAEKMTLLFTPFERLGAEATRVQGTGLGLALSRGLAEAMGGSLGITSVHGDGSTFWIELPLADESRVATEERRGSSRVIASQRSTGSVLYIEDNWSNVRLMDRILQLRPGVAFSHGATGEAGVARARDQHPDVILLDLHLSDMSGEDVLQQLLADETTRDIPVVVLSADAMAEQVKRLKAAGAAAYLTKPLDVSEVLAMLDELLAKRS
jgi:signal transduction histidine kinase